MRDIDLTNITEAAAQTFQGLPDARQRVLVQALVKSLHQYAKDTQLTHAEWRAALMFLHKVGDISSDKRSEFSLLSDVMGLSSMVDLLASRLDVTSATLIASLPLVKSGKLKALAALGKERSKHMPDIPTVAEGGLRDFQYANWLGIFAPGGTPPAVLNRLNEALVTVLKQPAIVAELDAQGSLAIGNTPEQFQQYVAAEAKRWQAVVDVAGIKLTQ